VNPLYPPVAERAQARCEYCRAPEGVFNFPFEVEHILPKSPGGTDRFENLALSCHACNRFKADFAHGIVVVTSLDVVCFIPAVTFGRSIFAPM